MRWRGLLQGGGVQHQGVVVLSKALQQNTFACPAYR